MADTNPTAKTIFDIVKERGTVVAVTAGPDAKALVNELFFSKTATAQEKINPNTGITPQTNDL